MNGSSMTSVGPRHADEHHGAGQVAGLERLPVHRRVADRLDAHVGAEAAGHRLDVLDGVGRRRVARVGGAELLGPLELAVVDVDGDDRRRRRPAATRRWPRRRRRRSRTRRPSCPGVTPPVLIAAPMPAITPQPSSPAAVAGAAGSTLVHCPAATSVFSAKAPMPSAGDSTVPSVSVIFCVALWVLKQYHGSPRGRPGTRRTRPAS